MHYKIIKQFKIEFYYRQRSVYQTIYLQAITYLCVCIYANRQIASHTHRLQIRTSILSNYLWPMVNHVLLQFMPFNGYQMAKLQLQDLSCTQHLWFLNCFISYFLALCMSFQTLLSVIHHDQRSKY